MQIGAMDRVIILGASRGLGAELVKHISQTGYPTVGFGRKEKALQALRDLHPLFEYRVADFSHHLGQDEALRFLSTENYTKVICVAGGGPFGPYHERAMRDHDWAWEVTFHFQARLLHALKVANQKDKQIIFVGSSVAESSPDPFAASYCAAKHALKALILSVRLENPEWDIRLFSPGYMDTDMLPIHAAVRQRGVYSPAAMARDLWTWSLSTDNTGHKVYPKHPV
jgi:short-subunit dehydrogenase